MPTRSPAAFTVVIPAYNPGKMLREALESVAAQTSLPEWVVVVDDGSSDGTFESARRWLDELGLPGQVLTHPNQGISATRNVGIAHRRTNTIALLDADDLWLPHHLANLRQAYELCPEAIVVFADSRFFGDPRSRTTLMAESHALALSETLLAPKIHRMSPAVFDCLLPGLFFPVSASSFRMDIGDPEPRFETDLKIGEDRFLFLKLARRGPLVYFNEQSCRTRRHDANMTHSDKEVWLRENSLLVLKKIRMDAELALTPSERSIVRTAKKGAANALLYAASQKGFASYVRGLRTTAGLLPAWHWWSLRNFVRAVRSSIKGQAS